MECATSLKSKLVIKKDFKSQFKLHSDQLAIPVVISILNIAIQFLKSRHDSESASRLRASAVPRKILENACLYIGYAWVYYLIHSANIFGSFQYVKEVCLGVSLFLFKYRQIVLFEDKFNDFCFGVYYIPLQIILIEVAANYGPVVYCLLTFCINR